MNNSKDSNAKKDEWLKTMRQVVDQYAINNDANSLYEKYNKRRIVFFAAIAALSLLISYFFNDFVYIAVLLTAVMLWKTYRSFHQPYSLLHGRMGKIAVECQIPIDKALIKSLQEARPGNSSSEDEEFFTQLNIDLMERILDNYRARKSHAVYLCDVSHAINEIEFHWDNLIAKHKSSTAVKQLKSDIINAKEMLADERTA